MARQHIVKLGCHLAQLWQPRPRHTGKVVVLVVIAHIVRQHVERSIVRPGLLLDAAKHVVFGNEMRGARMQTAGKEAALQQIDQRGPSGIAHQCNIQHGDKGHVEGVPDRRSLRSNEPRSQRVKENLERGKERLTEHVAQHHTLELRGQVRIRAVLTEVLVVLEVVRLERHCIRHANRTVDKDRPESVGAQAAEGKVVRDLVDGQEHVLVRRTAHGIRDEQKLPRKRMQRRVLGQIHRQAELEQQHGERDVLGERLVAHEPSHLGMRLEDGHAPRAVRLLGVHPEKVLLGRGCDAGQPRLAVGSCDANRLRSGRQDGVLCARDVGQRRIVELVLKRATLGRDIVVVAGERGGRVGGVRELRRRRARVACRRRGRRRGARDVRA
ncbi:hypothetical protein L1887_49083 [Cichorium endivia]|nr:hypothetical protein L1887_49083 [Cichorium endivia]